MEKYLSTEFWGDFYRKIANWVITDLPSLIILLVLIFVALRFARILVSRLKKILKKRHQDEEGHADLEAEKRINTLMGIVAGILIIFIWATFFMIFMNKIGINIGPLLASAGILGLAIGFGAQELVRDFITGFFILLEDQVRTGDVAIINGTGGLVERIELRTIRLRDLSGVVHIFQNGKINTLSNMTKTWSAMVFEIGVAYKEDIDKVISLIKEVGADLKKDEAFTGKINEDIEVFGVDSFGDSAVVIKARLKTTPGDQWSTGREFRRRLKMVFDENRIEIPFPHRTIYWGEEITPLELKVDDKGLQEKKK